MKKSTNYLKMTWMALALFVVQPDLPAMSNGHGNTDSRQAATSKARTIQLPFQLAHKLIVVEGRVENNSGLFLLDTGAERLVLNQKYFSNASTKSRGHWAGIMGSTKSVPFTRINTFQLGAFSFPGLQANLLDLSHIEKQRNIQLLGIIGYEVLKDLEVGVTQNQVEAMVGILNQLHHGRQTSHNMRTSLTSLDHVVKSIGYQLDGFLGYEFLHNKRTLINYKKKLLFFYK